MQIKLPLWEIAPVAAANSFFVPPVQPLVSRTWPRIIVPVGLGLTLVWGSFLGYGLVRLIELI